MTAFLGEPTEAKASGVCFSAAAILPSLLSFVLTVALLAVGLKIDETDYPDWYLYLSYILPQLSFLAIAVFYLKWTKRGITPTLQKQARVKPVYFLVALVLQTSLLCLSSLNSWFLSLLGGLGYESSEILIPSVDGAGFFGVLLTVALLPALMEEIFFRGVLLRGLRSFGDIGATLLCGALFALFHQTPEQTAYQFVCGAAFAWVAIRAGSVLPTVLSHFINNALIIFEYKFEFMSAIQTPLLAVSLVCAAAFVVWAIFDRKEIRKKTDDKTEKRNFWLYACVGVGICALVWLVAFFTGVFA